MPALRPRGARRASRRPLPLAALATVLACADPPPVEGPATPQPPAALFVDRTAASGLDFVHFNGMSGGLFLSEITCGAGALVDVDGDGDLDAYLLQGQMRGDRRLDEAPVAPRHPLPLTDRLYLNQLEPGGPHSVDPVFRDATADMGVAATGYGCGVAAGDVDNDGLPELYLANLGPDQLLRNLGDGTFDDATAAAGLGDPGSGVVATLLDYDRDGWLDLFVGNNVGFDDSGATRCTSLTGAPDYCGPGAYPSQPDRLYRNRGDGTFEDVTAVAGLATTPPRPTLGAVAADFDDDGWQDLYVANDGQPNHLWINRRDGTFEERAWLAGCAVNGDGSPEASMGVATADFDGDGDTDLFLSHLIKETNTFYRNDGGLAFADATAAAGLGPPSLGFTSFGTGPLDVENDGRLDLLVVNGAVTLIPELVAIGDPFPLHQRNQLFRNLGGDGGRLRFAEITTQAGEAFELSEVSRGAALGDVDNDGDTDLLVINNNGPARLLINQVGQKAAWLGLRLLTGDPPRDALGARAALLRGGRPHLWRRVAADGSYSAASDPRLLFGLGQAAAPVDGIRVRWPDGSEEDFAGGEPGAYRALRQGEGRPAPRARASGSAAPTSDTHPRP